MFPRQMDVPYVVQEVQVLGAFSPVAIQIQTVRNQFHDVAEVDLQANDVENNPHAERSIRPSVQQGVSTIAITPAPSRALDAAGLLAGNMVSVIMVTDPPALSAPPTSGVSSVRVDMEVSDHRPGVVEVTSQNLKMAQNQLGVLQQQAVSQVKPTPLVTQIFLFLSVSLPLSLSLSFLPLSSTCCSRFSWSRLFQYRYWGW